MSEKGKKEEKAGMKSVRAGRTKTHKPERKRNARKWFSLDSLMGKALCVLLVIILTLGAFLAPKLLNNLYDAGTLMQIAYLDMDLSPYAVPYTTFQDKIEAVAKARTAGMRFTSLPAEEAADRISDEELIGIVNAEMETAGRSTEMLFRESWWDALTIDNLISREKRTVYMRAPADGEDNSQEITPFQVWMLMFELRGEQNEVVLYDGNGKEKKTTYQFATHRLIVCMDADFYKIVAFALRGAHDKMNELYDWDLIYPFGAGPDAPEDMQKIAAIYRDSGNKETQTYLGHGICEAWVDYWDITLKDYLYQIGREGTLGAYLIFENETAGIPAESSGADEELEARGREMRTLEAAGYPAEVLPVIEAGETFLEAGSMVEWEEADYNIWILKTGCTEFFEMMQF